jgi:lipopolysaccharide export system permease protein
MRLHLTAIERYVLGQTLLSVLGAAAIICSVVLLINYAELSRQIGVRVDIGFAQTVYLTALNSPATLVVLLPFVFLFGTAFAFITLNRRSELVAMRAAGVSAWRFIMPAAVAAFLVGAITVAVLNPITARLTGMFEDARAALISGVTQKPSDIWLPQGDTKKRILIHARSSDSRGGEVHLKGVSMFIYSVDAGGGMNFTRRLEAAEAVLHPGYWSLTDVRDTIPGGAAVRSGSGSISTNLEGRKEVERIASPNSISAWELPGVIKRTEEAGFSSLGYRLRLHQLLAMPLLFAAMSILAAAFSLRLMRLGGLAVLASSGVALGFLFFFMNKFSLALGEAGTLPAFAAAWAPPVLALLCGLTLLCYTEDG